MGQGSVYYWSRRTERTACFPDKVISLRLLCVGRRWPCVRLVQWAFLPATEILAKDVRFYKRDHSFNEKYAIVQSHVRG